MITTSISTGACAANKDICLKNIKMVFPLGVSVMNESGSILDKIVKQYIMNAVYTSLPNPNLAPNLSGYVNLSSNYANTDNVSLDGPIPITTMQQIFNLMPLMQPYFYYLKWLRCII